MANKDMHKNKPQQQPHQQQSDLGKGSFDQNKQPEDRDLNKQAGSQSGEIDRDRSDDLKQ